MFSKMVQNTEDNGKVNIDMDVVNKFGKTVQDTKEIGDTIKPMVREHSGTCTETSTMGNGVMTKLMVMEFILTQMEQSTRVIGKMIYNTAMVSNNGQMGRSMRETMFKAVSMDKVPTPGKMDQSTQAAGERTRSTEKESING